MAKVTVKILGHPTGVNDACFENTIAIQSIPLGSSAPLCIHRGGAGDIYGNILRQDGWLGVADPAQGVLCIMIDPLGVGMPGAIELNERGIEMMGGAAVLQLDSPGI